MDKIRQSFSFGVLWHTNRETKALDILTRVTYTGKPILLADMD